MKFIIFITLGFVNLFSLFSDIIFENSYQNAMNEARRLDKNVLILVGREVKDNLIKEFFNSFEDDKILKVIAQNNIFLVIDVNNEIFGEISLKKSPTLFFVDSKSEQIKATYVGSIKDAVRFDKEFLSYVLGISKLDDIIQKRNNYEINTFDDKVFFYKTLDGHWRLKMNGQDKKLLPSQRELKEFLVFRDENEDKLYAFPKSLQGNIYFSETANEEWKPFGKIKS
ncbi:hypothetical protein CR532_00335 [Candidatus Borreliella tachyglossi]|uniref:Uncharacterized protein n=1 Tax=Candidatus Borreliella tachyglossi TaxID=1964448 RepID=A0A2S1LW20_9SPIR|nr:hypothetical protein [Candidatus Borreliella tachyglossi]AWG42465.1 hypothetical protein CR532_00335 [Candidatus Borreliella tachyglossi]